MNNTPKTVEEILTSRFCCSDMRCNQGHLMEVDDDGNVSDYGKCTCMKRIDEAITALNELIRNERIDELEKIDWATGDGGYYFVKDRIAELRAEERLQP